eukprot:CAMPEP_0172386958 /NCGR_PEP_ID=MMETSP1061-20121228/4395_1 /TAXON_ID=37318 /ORGANISM="Pseudo-nitzschia pungens, Strain cf. pungens" /LENGTH=839 /DNA_ID=CAMNT_0013116501 /DNA_START=361 /DNA_END=2880 /DNA_ORIENTATION=+
MTDPPPISNIVVGNANGGSLAQRPFQQQGVVVDTTFHRAVHKIRLSALSHNFSEVESAANRQRCSVIVVVKADGYGHGAIPTAIFLADKIGADAFAVATLEEGIALRKALQETASTNPGYHENLNHYFNLKQTLNATNDHRRNSCGSSKAVEQDSMSLITNSAFTAMYGGGVFGGTGGKQTRRRGLLRAAHIRILVLGPPVGFPRCFDDYYHYNIEVMISGPEVAMALYEWVSNTDERKRLQVERAANELKEKILLEPAAKATTLNTKSIIVNNPAEEESDRTATPSVAQHAADNNSEASSTGRSSSRSSASGGPIHQQIPSATLTNVTGSDLAREVREILKNQKLAAETQKQQQKEQLQQQRNQQNRIPPVGTTSGVQTPMSGNSSEVTPVSSIPDLTANTAAMTMSTAATTATTSARTSAFCPDRNNNNNNNNNDNRSNGAKHSNDNAAVQVFAGLEEIARHSRIRQKAMASEVFHEHGGDDEDDESGDNSNFVDGEMKSHQKQNHDRGSLDQAGDSPLVSPASFGLGPRIPTNTNRKALPMITPTKKRLRWHALVDSGMGRLGFKPDQVLPEEQGKRRDTVEILKELVDLEVTPDCPIEFYGMCTHMAEANSTSTFSDSQMKKFKSLLKRVRTAGISVPTLSTDNSAALLTTNLVHFTANAKELLTQTDADTRGYVRTGGAIYGQRPSFTQLQAISTLMASVRHVASLKEGESVGYDRAYVASMNVRIATLTIGFADGYPRELGNGVGSVSIRGHLFPVAGNVCMDMLMVELGPAGDTDGIGAQVVVGDTAILWGPDDGEEGEGHVRLRDVAATLKTTQSALTCGLNKERVLRQYA